MPRALRCIVVPACVFAAAVLLTTPVSASKGGTTLSARGASLRRPADVVTKLLEPVQGCQVLLDAGTGDCAVVQTAHGYLVVTVEPGPFIDEVLISRPWVARVYRASKTVKNGEEIALSTRPQGTYPGPQYANVTAKVADVTGDGKEELVLGYRSEGTGQILDVDIVGTTSDGTPRVLAHETLYKATVDLEAGRLVQYVPVYGKGEPNCCPKYIERDVVRFRNGAFRIERGPRTLTKRAHIPPGDLG